MDVPESPSYATPHNFLGSPGQYEFLIIDSTESATLTIWFRNNILNNYDLNGDLQIILVPSYGSASVDAPITCPAWDSLTKTGGVLTLIVGKTLTLNANIDVSGKGFAGGVPALGAGLCADPDINLQKYAYDASDNNSGFKGEGVASMAWIDLTTQLPIYPAYAKGQGMNFNGGGGGNGRFSGGGGGSNYGAGGTGGRENSDICVTPLPGGLGGRQIKFTALAGGIFLGGGGGGSTYSGGGTATAGGRGGGIIIILCNDIIGNGYSLKADGVSPSSTATGTAGAGGGGAGGSVALYLESFSTDSNLSLTANGAKGGNNNGTFGEGGGGGGGLIWVSNIAIPGNVTRSAIPGPPGTRSGGSTAGSGAVGENLTTFIPVLNGFLFNSIRSFYSRDINDTICSNNIPYPILGTSPVGGSGDYTYLWQKKNDSGGIWTDIPSSDVINYNFPATESDTFFIRRVVTDNIAVPLLSDTSIAVNIVVQPEILNNLVMFQSDIISLTDTICYNGDPRLIDQVLPDLIIPTTTYYSIKWQDSSASGSWGTTLGSSKSYDPPAGLTRLGNTWYRRTVRSGYCTDSTAKVRITVLDTISKNIIITRYDTICHGGIFTNLISDPGLGGGDGTYRYLWEYSQTGSSGTWSTATGTATNSTYNPDELDPGYPGKLFYRRKVFSGNHNVCVDTSKSAVRVDWPAITGNNIAADETICAGSVPTGLTGSVPINGDGIYIYTWQDSSKFHNWANIPGFVNVTAIDYSPVALTDTTSYRRIAYSSVCADTSTAAIKMVHKLISNNKINLLSGIMDSTICSGSTTKLLKGMDPSGGTDNPADDIFEWQLSNNLVSWNTAPAPADASDYQPGDLVNATGNPVNYYFRRYFISGQCSSFSDTLSIEVLPKIANNNISSDRTVCFNTDTVQLNGTVLTGGDGNPVWLWQESINSGVSWATAAGVPDSRNYNPPLLQIPTQYRRIVYSGLSDCCVDTSNFVSININPLPSAEIVTVTDTICEGVNYLLNLNITQNTASPWTIIYEANSTQQPPVNITDAVSTFQVIPAINNSLSMDSVTYKLVSVQDNYGCRAPVDSLKGQGKFIVYNTPEPQPGADQSVCGPEYTLSATPSYGTGRWYYPSVPLVDSIPNGPQFTVWVDSTLAPLQSDYKFIWEEANWKCVAKDSVTISFYKRTDIADAGPDRDLYTFDKVDTLHAAAPLIGTGMWNVVSGGATISNDSIISNLSHGENVFQWVITNGVCVSSDQVIISVYDLIIPDGFSPNGDMVNDKFEIKGLDLNFSEVSLRILNSAGAEVFYTTNANASEWTEWNGENTNGPLPDGTYYYLLTVKSLRNGTTLKKSGFIVLKRDKIL